MSEGVVTVEAQEYKASIGHGLCVLLGVEKGDDEAVATWVAKKLANLRVFADEQRNMNLSVLDVAGKILLVSQFTLAGDCTKGNRPGFDRAAPPEQGRRLYEHVAHELRQVHNVDVACGVFGAMMRVSIVNDGPVTLIVQKSA